MEGRSNTLKKEENMLYLVPRAEPQTEPEEEPKETESQIIDLYTRADALRDKVLIDYTILGKQIGLLVPVALTFSLNVDLTPNTQEREKGQTLQNRLLDVFSVFVFLTTVRNIESDTMMFHVNIRRITLKQTELVMNLERKKIKVHIGGGDKGEPVLTFMLPEEN